MNKNFKIYITIYIAILFILGSFALGLAFGHYYIPSKKSATAEISEVKENLDLFWETWNLLEKKYIGRKDLDKEKMIYGAIKGMVKSLGDSYTVFMPPAESKEFKEAVDGNFEGIGIEIDVKNDNLTVIAPLEGYPAEKAGIRTGDIIIKIGDKFTSDLDIEEAVSLIRGPRGTKVILTVLHESSKKPEEITVERTVIHVKSVKWEFAPREKTNGEKIAYIKISRFGNDTMDEFKKAYKEILSQDIKKVILDLRNNPGGFLDTAVELSSEFIDGTKVVVTEAYLKKELNINHFTRGKANFKDIKVVVLINNGSASASEIVAGALHDIKGIQLIGEKSFGKGSVQSLEPLQGGSSIRITVAEWLTPNGKNINKEGIEPDIKVEINEEDIKNNRDPQLDKAIEVIKGI